MKRSESRILTTHAGSLPRPGGLVEMLGAVSRGEPVDEAALAEAAREATSDVVRAQVEAGVDVVNGGEQSRISFSTYVTQRMSGFGGGWTRRGHRDQNEFPSIARPRVVQLMRDVPMCVGPLSYDRLDVAERECDDLFVAVSGSGAVNEELFMTAASPGIITLAAHPVQLADVAPPEAAQEGPEGGWCLDRAVENTGRPTGTQRIGVADAVAASQRGGDQRHYLVAGVGPPRGIAQVEALLDELGQAEVPCQGGRQEQPGIGHQAVVVKDDADTVGIVPWQHLLGAPFPGSVFVAKPLSQKHRSTFLPLQDANPTPSFGGFGGLGSADLAFSDFTTFRFVQGHTQRHIFVIEWTVPLAVPFQLGARNLARAVIPMDYRLAGGLIFVHIKGHRLTLLDGLVCR